MSERQIMIPVALLESLTDEDACRLDHHGGCQAHGYLSLEEGEVCPQRDAKDRLAAVETWDGPNNLVALYRAGGKVQQLDGSKLTLHSHEYRSRSEAEEDAGAARRLPYVLAAWVERTEWVRLPDAEQVSP